MKVMIAPKQFSRKIARNIEKSEDDLSVHSQI